jgi:UDP-N-acetylglucosamine diphosphorylase/glucosamine-1-phosphate N-acetyltransferase
MTVLVFEDGSHDNFYPLSLSRPLCGLRCGAFTFDERLRLLTHGAVHSYRVRPQAADVTRELYSGSLVNGSIDESDDLLLLNALYAPSAIDIRKGEVFVSGSRLAAARLDAKGIAKLRAHIESRDGPVDIHMFDGCSHREIPGNDFFPAYIWDIVSHNGDMIRRDFALLDRSEYRTGNERCTLVGDPDSLLISGDVTIDPFVVIDTRKGPVMIGAGTIINSFTRIEGPCVIGEGSVITGAKIREGCSFGPVCRIGGEIEDTIMQGYSNKYHDGFIGHAYIGEWVNLGALTTNSDLRNDYGDVECRMPSGLVNTGSGKVGCFIGDFTKTGIGTLINTGSTIGVGAMIVHSGRMTPPHVPSFTRFIKNELRSPESVDSIIAANRIACARRGKTLSASMGKTLEELFTSGGKERQTEVDAWNGALK